MARQRGEEGADAGEASRSQEHAARRRLRLRRGGGVGAEKAGGGADFSRCECGGPYQIFFKERRLLLHLPCGASIGGFSGSPCEQKKREMKKDKKKRINKK
jgi:hypothetical protein